MRKKTALTWLEAADTKLALQYGYSQHTIAAYFGVNQARISEVKTGKKWHFLVPSRHLPRDFPPIPESGFEERQRKRA